MYQTLSAEGAWMVSFALSVLGGAIFVSIAAGVVGLQGVTASGAVVYGLALTLLGWAASLLPVYRVVPVPGLEWLVTPLLLVVVVKGLFESTLGQAIGVVALSYGLHFLAGVMLRLLLPYAL
jgi:hypothetical protein